MLQATAFGRPLEQAIGNSGIGLDSLEFWKARKAVLENVKIQGCYLASLLSQRLKK